jgi:Ca2+-binding RTX toxin-like protein
VLKGGGGMDALTSSAGADTFVWTSTTETLQAGDQADVITDFNRAEGDRIDVSFIDADGNAANGNQAFTFVGVVNFSTNFFTGPGQIAYFNTGTDTYILLNTQVGPGPTDFEEATIHLTGSFVIDASWFIL